MAPVRKPTRRTLLLLVFAALAIFHISGCGSLDDGVARVVSITLSPTELNARAGDIVALEAVATHDDETQSTVTALAAWTSSATGVATVSDGGVVTAVAAGTAQVSASYNGVDSNTVTVEVAAMPILPTASYWPLSIGNHWEYTGTEVTPNAATRAGEPITMTLTVSRQAPISGVPWFEVLTKGSDPLDPPGYMYVRHDPEGLMRYESVGTVPMNLLDARLTAGTTWVDPDDARISFEILSTTEHVDVPAGSYDDCLLVEQTDTYYSPPSRQQVWYKSGLGIVRSRLYSGDELTIEQNLMRADVLEN